MTLHSTIKKIILLFCIFQVHFIDAQPKVLFKEELNVELINNISPDLKKGSSLKVQGVVTKSYNNLTLPFIMCKLSSGEIIFIEYDELKKFEFKDINTVQKFWDKNCLISDVYKRFITSGYQYEIRDELNESTAQFIHTLTKADRFFNDDFYEDYLYTLINKIYGGILSDGRSGNIQVKILKDNIPNACITASGTLLISTSLLSLIQSEDELMAILGHELAHFILDHHIINYTRETQLKKNAEFWSYFATILAAGADAYFSAKNKNHIPGVLTASVAILSTAISENTVSKIGANYSKEQELIADRLAKQILELSGYNTDAMSAVLTRLENYFYLIGDQSALTGGITHPSFRYRIEAIGEIEDILKFKDSDFLKKTSGINSYTGWIELWYYSRHITANNIVTRNIENNVAIESDYIVKAIVLRRLSNTEETNHKVLELLQKAKNLSVNPLGIVYKEEGITHLRMGNKTEAEASFKEYLIILMDNVTDSMRQQDEILWTQQMIYKSQRF